nr:RHS repeat-associated core domain-containing protein [Pseudomonas sp. CCOS 191]
MSVLHRWHRACQAVTYTPYGASPAAMMQGFTGQLCEHRGVYLLGNGYRAYNPVLMRFQSPDKLSPFGDGGVGAYGYCKGDPINYVDRTGHVRGAPKAQKILPVLREEWLSLDPKLFRATKEFKKDVVRHYGKVKKLKEYSADLLGMPGQEPDFENSRVWAVGADDHLTSMKYHLDYRLLVQEPKLEARRLALRELFHNDDQRILLYENAVNERKELRKAYGPGPANNILHVLSDLGTRLRDTFS